MENPISIIITDDKPRWRQAVRNALDDFHINTLAEADNGVELLEQLKTLEPDVILLDLRMPLMDGNETMLLLSEKYPDKKVIVISYNDEPLLMEDFVRRGAKGYLSKDEIAGNIDELVRAIRRVHKGGRYTNFEKNRESAIFKIRQKEIIYLIAKGKKNNEIAAIYKLSPSAIEKQKKKIMQLAKVKTHEELCCYIFEMGLNYFEPPRI